MMSIVFPLIASSALVFFGYFALWSSSQANTPKGISSFGRVLSIILFVIAGLVLVSPVAVRHFHGSHSMGRMEMQGRPPYMGHMPRQGCFPQHWMGKRYMQDQPAAAPEQKPEGPASR